MGEEIRILAADDHAVVREGLRALIDTEPGMELVGEASDGAEAVGRAQAIQPDVVLLDLVMPRHRMTCCGRFGRCTAASRRCIQRSRGS